MRRSASPAHRPYGHWPIGWRCLRVYGNKSRVSASKAAGGGVRKATMAVQKWIIFAQMRLSSQLAALRANVSHAARDIRSRDSKNTAHIVFYLTVASSVQHYLSPRHIQQAQTHADYRLALSMCSCEFAECPLGCLLACA